MYIRYIENALTIVDNTTLAGAFFGIMMKFNYDAAGWCMYVIPIMEFLIHNALELPFTT